MIERSLDYCHVYRIRSAYIVLCGDTTGFEISRVLRRSAWTLDPKKLIYNKTQSND